MKSKQILITLILCLGSLSTAFASLSSHPQKLLDTINPNKNENIRLHITNLGPSSVLSYQVSSNENWISFDKTTGNINVKDTVTISIKIDAGKLKSGLNKGSVIIGDPHHGPTTIPVEVMNNTVSDVEEELFSKSNSINIYPNPAISEANVEFSLIKSGFISIDFCDIQGNTLLNVFNGNIGEGNHKLNINTSKFSSGMYFIKMNVNNNLIVKKIIINK